MMVNKRRSARPKSKATTAKRQTTKPSTPKALRGPPAGGRSRQTYDKLLDAAAYLLSEIGFEKLTTNAICARANMTPPALYNYFKDKFEILEALAQRLLKRQNDAYAAWLFRGDDWSNLDKQTEFLEGWYRIAANIIATEPGAQWTMRALRAMPNLAHVRVESQRMLTARLYEFYRSIRPDLDPELLWIRLRIRIECGWVVDELAMEEDKIPHDVLFHEVAQLLGVAALASA
jgi:AcrR family transcriptional regulator